jgi:hypothetical protein
VADEIRQGRCHVQRLTLGMHHGAISDATEAVHAIASPIKLDCNLEHLTLEMENSFTDEAAGALAEALTINETLRLLRLDDILFPGHPVHTRSRLGGQSYEGLSAMLRVNTSLRLVLPASASDDVATFVDDRDLEHFEQMLIELRLNQVGRGRLLASNQSTREVWVDALQELCPQNDDDRLKVSCLYSLLRLYPDVCMLELNHTTKPGTLFDGSSPKIDDDFIDEEYV